MSVNPQPPDPHPGHAASALPRLYLQALKTARSGQSFYVPRQWSKAAQGALHALVGQRIGALVTWIAVVAPDPAPVDGMTARH